MKDNVAERMSTLEKKVAEIMKAADTPVLALVDNAGYPRASTISCVKTEGIDRAWFATGNSTGKAGCLRGNKKASLCFRVEGDNVTLMGNMVVHEEPEVKAAFWQDWFQHHFPGGPTDPEYIVLEFQTERGVFWIGNEYEESHLGKEMTVKADHTQENATPIRLNKGDRVQLGERSDNTGNWPNWIFCTNLSGTGNGWTPVQALIIEGEMAVARVDYDAKELTVKKGTVVKGYTELNGWIWCSVDRGDKIEEGWIPKENLQ